MDLQDNEKVGESGYFGNSVPRGYTRDEGRSLGVGLQEQAPNHLKLLW
jgi:hypothetical protein